jgi:hypothetical protein
MLKNKDYTCTTRGRSKGRLKQSPFCWSAVSQKRGTGIWYRYRLFEEGIFPLKGQATGLPALNTITYESSVVYPDPVAQGSETLCMSRIGISN